MRRSAAARAGAAASFAEIGAGDVAILGHYASLPQCEKDVREAENLFEVNGVPYLNTTTASVEEMAATIMQQLAPNYRLPAGSD